VTGRASRINSWGSLLICSPLVCHSCNTVSDSTSASGRLEDRIGKEYEGEQGKQYLQSEAT